MIITYPDDGLYLLYHIVDLHGQIVHTYRDFRSAFLGREGDQRICIWQEPSSGREGRWLTDAPTPVKGLHP